MCNGPQTQKQRTAPYSAQSFGPHDRPAPVTEDGKLRTTNKDLCFLSFVDKGERRQMQSTTATKNVRRHAVLQISRRSCRLYAIYSCHGRVLLRRVLRGDAHLELPVFVDGLDSPVELLAQRLREEALDRHVELLGEDNC
jgi:hypothetical protein